MGKKNPVIAYYEDKVNSALRAGINIGLQLGSDCYQMALNDPEVMGRDTLGRSRMTRLMDAAEANVDCYLVAVDYREAEADVAQEKMDSRLRKIWGEIFLPFNERYPWLKKCNYGGAKK